MPTPYVKTGYSGDTAGSTMGLRGVDIPPAPDFWGDWEAMQSRLQKPKPAAQAQALREPRMPRLSSRGPSPESVRAQLPGPTPSPVTARQFARPTMSQQGVWGNYVNPIDVPAELVGTIPTGFFTDDATSNYTYSPNVNPMRYQTGSTQRTRT